MVVRKDAASFSIDPKESGARALHLAFEKTNLLIEADSSDLVPPTSFLGLGIMGPAGKSASMSVCNRCFKNLLKDCEDLHVIPGFRQTSESYRGFYNRLLAEEGRTSAIASVDHDSILRPFRFTGIPGI
eukprot:1139020-Amorphochlora_amoeboformis.AAC.2